MFRILIDGPAVSKPDAMNHAIEMARRFHRNRQLKESGVMHGIEYHPLLADYHIHVWWTEKRNIRVWVEDNEEAEQC